MSEVEPLAEAGAVPAFSDAQKRAIADEVAREERAARPWRTDDKTIFQIGGRRFQIAKKGRAQAEQIVAINTWLRQHIAPLATAMQGRDTKDAAAGWDIFAAMLGELTVEAQMELASALLGKTDCDGQPVTSEFVDEVYYIAWVDDALESAAQVAAVQRVMTAFFTNIG